MALGALDKVAQQIVEIKPAMKESTIKAIEEEGLTEDKYKEILSTYHQYEAKYMSG